MRSIQTRGVVWILVSWLLPALAGASTVDEADAMALIKATKCLTCHSVDKQKDGPPYKEVAEMYRGDADAEQKIIDWLSQEHEVEIDGEPDTHPKAATTDAARIGNLARWVLSR